MRREAAWVAGAYTGAAAASRDDCRGRDGRCPLGKARTLSVPCASAVNGSAGEYYTDYVPGPVILGHSRLVR